MMDEFSNIKLNEVLARVSLHLAQLADKITSAEAIISRSIIDNIKLDEVDTLSVQNLDFVKQSITDIALLLAALSKETDLSLLDPSAMKMEKTREILFSAKQTKVTPSGVVDIF